MESVSAEIKPSREVEKNKSEDPGLLALIREDRRANGRSIWRPGFQAMAMYRLGRWAGEGPFYRRPALWLADFLYVFIRNVYGIELYRTATIGRRFTIGHQGAIVVHRYCTIGDDCVIRQGSTIGYATSEEATGSTHGPRLGNRVEVGAGAIIMGNVRIGSDVRIGPNVVVSTDIPENSTVFPPRSKVVTWG